MQLDQKLMLEYRFEEPAVNKIDAASPIPLPSPNNTPARIPGNACRLITFTAVSNFVDPNEYAPSFRPSWHHLDCFIHVSSNNRNFQ